MTGLEAGLTWAAVVSYAVVTALLVSIVSFQSARALWAAPRLGAVGVLAHAAALGLRMASSGHLPVKGNYENGSTAALFIALPAVVLAWRRPNLRVAALAALPLSLLALGWGLLHHDPATALTPPYKSTWLVVHVVFANLSYGAFSLACGAGVAWLLRERRERRGRALGLLDRLPGLDALDDLIYRFVLFGFVASAAMIVTGAFWADSLWGTYWGWDPVETWSLVTWLTYGAFIHLRVVHHWHGRRLAWLAVGSIAFVMISFWGVNFLSSTAHSFMMM